MGMRKWYYLILISLTGQLQAQIFELPRFVSNSIKAQVSFNEDSLISQQGIISITKFKKNSFLDEIIERSDTEFIKTYNDSGKLIREQVFESDGRATNYLYSYKIKGTNLVRITLKENDTSYKRTEIMDVYGNILEDNCKGKPAYYQCSNNYEHNRLVKKVDDKFVINYEMNNDKNIEIITSFYYGYLNDKKEIHYDRNGRKLKVFQYEIAGNGDLTGRKIPLETFVYNTDGQLLRIIKYDEFEREITTDSIEYKNGRLDKHYVKNKAIIEYNYNGNNKVASITLYLYNPLSQLAFPIEKWDYSYDSLKPEVPKKIVKYKGYPDGELKQVSQVYYNILYKGENISGKG